MHRADLHRIENMLSSLCVTIRKRSRNMPDFSIHDIIPFVNHSSYTMVVLLLCSYWVVGFVTIMVDFVTTYMCSEENTNNV